MLFVFSTDDEILVEMSYLQNTYVIYRLLVLIAADVNYYNTDLYPFLSIGVGKIQTNVIPIVTNANDERRQKPVLSIENEVREYAGNGLEKTDLKYRQTQQPMNSENRLHRLEQRRHKFDRQIL
jgi:hypothetical protein